MMPEKAAGRANSSQNLIQREFLRSYGSLLLVFFCTQRKTILREEERRWRTLHSHVRKKRVVASKFVWNRYIFRRLSAARRQLKMISDAIYEDVDVENRKASRRINDLKSGQANIVETNNKKSNSPIFSVVLCCSSRGMRFTFSSRVVIGAFSAEKIFKQYD